MIHVSFALIVLSLISSTVSLVLSPFMKGIPCDTRRYLIRVAIAWFLLVLTCTVYGYFFMLPARYHSFHEYLRPVTLVAEGFFLFSAQRFLMETGLPGSRRGKILSVGISSPFLILALLSYASLVSGSSDFEQSVLLSSVILAVAVAVWMMAFPGFLWRRITTAGRRYYRVSIFFFASIVGLYLFTWFTDPAIFEPHTSTVFFSFWSIGFALFAAGNLRSDRSVRGDEKPEIPAVPGMKAAGSSEATQPSLLVARYGLSERETQVALRLCSGGSNKEIAWDLSISEATVKKHLTSIFSKTETSSRMELFRLLSGNGPLPPK